MPEEEELLLDGPMPEEELLLDDLPPEEELLLEGPTPEEELLLEGPTPEEELLLDDPTPEDEPLLEEALPEDEVVPLDDPPPLELLVDDPPPSGVELPLSELPHAGSSSPTPMAHSHGDQTRRSKAFVVFSRCMRFSLEWSYDQSLRPPAVPCDRSNGSQHD
jgi:hypothetical protein